MQQNTMQPKKKKKEGKSAIWNDMDEPCGHYAKEKSQSQKDKYYMILLLWGVYDSEIRQCLGDLVS